VYEAGSVFSPSILDITDAQLMASFSAALGNVAAVSLATNFPTQASLPHLVMNAFREIAGVGLAADFIFPQIEKVKEMIDNPEKFASAAAAPVAAAGSAAQPAAAAAAVPEPEEEEEEAGDFGLFD
jgi:large subunit ribosomal protein LP0